MFSPCPFIIDSLLNHNIIYISGLNVRRFLVEELLLTVIYNLLAYFSEVKLEFNE